MTSADEFILTCFRRAAAADRLGHAYLLSGVTGDAALRLGEAIARLLLCPDGGCNECGVCRSIEAGNCPDLHPLRPPEEKRTIQVDDLREKVLHEASLKTFGNERKLFLIVDADAMTPGAANAFLKTLEQPPGGSVMLLFSDRPEKMPPTIASRCFRLRVGSGSGEPAKPEPCDEIVVRLAKESVATSLDIAEAMSAACPGDNQDQRRLKVLALLDGVFVICRDGLLGEGPLADAGYDAILDGVQTVAEAQRQIDGNGNLDLVLDRFTARFTGVITTGARSTDARTSER